jgi:hypothetical protein
VYKPVPACSNALAANFSPGKPGANAMNTAAHYDPVTEDAARLLAIVKGAAYLVALLRQGRVDDADPNVQMWLNRELDDILDELEPMLDRTGHLSAYQDLHRNLRVM